MAPRGRGPRREEPAAPPETKADDPAEAGAGDEPGLEDEALPTDIRDEDPPLAEDDSGRARGTAAETTPWDADPFKMIAPQGTVGSLGQPDAFVERPLPGTRVALPDEKLARDGMAEYPDEALVNIKLWEINTAGLAGDPIMYQEGVLYSTAKNPLLWIPYAGRWYMEIIQQGTGKRLVKKAFRTRGDPAPANYRPTIEGGSDMDDTQLTMKLISLGILRPGQVQQQQWLPSGAVPGPVYGDVQNQIAKLETKIERLEKERNDAVQAKNDAERRHDLKDSELRATDKEVRRLEATIAELKAEVKAAPKAGSSTPEWLQVVTALKPTDQITPKDLLGFFKREREDGSGDKFGDLNAALDFVEKARKAAGGAAVGAGGESTLKDIVGLLGKAGDIIQGRQKLEALDRARNPQAPPPPPPPPALPPATPAESEQDKVALECTINKVLHGFRAKEDPATVAKRLASAYLWAADLDMARVDHQVDQFFGALPKETEEVLVWFGSIQDPVVPPDYCKLVAKAWRAAMRLPEEQKPAPKAPETPPASPPPAAQPGPGGADGGAASPQPPPIDPAGPQATAPSKPN